LNIVRCSLAAGGLAALEAIINHLRVGWCFTLFAALCSTAFTTLLARLCIKIDFKLAHIIGRDTCRRSIRNTVTFETHKRLINVRYQAKAHISPQDNTYRHTL